MSVEQKWKTLKTIIYKYILSLAPSMFFFAVNIYCRYLCIYCECVSSLPYLNKGVKECFRLLLVEATCLIIRFDFDFESTDREGDWLPTWLKWLTYVQNHFHCCHEWFVFMNCSHIFLCLTFKDFVSVFLFYVSIVDTYLLRIFFPLIYLFFAFILKWISTFRLFGSDGLRIITEWEVVMSVDILYVMSIIIYGVIYYSVIQKGHQRYI